MVCYNFSKLAAIIQKIFNQSYIVGKALMFFKVKHSIRWNLIAD